MPAEVIKQKFDFKKGTCGLKIIKGKKATVIVTEIADNSGDSIANAFDSIATQIYHQFLSNYSVNDITWVEHYNKGSYKWANNYSEILDQVFLSWNPNTKEFHTLEWRSHLQEPCEITKTFWENDFVV